jgi:hypothetical protein
MVFDSQTFEFESLNLTCPASVRRPAATHDQPKIHKPVFLKNAKREYRSTRYNNSNDHCCCLLFFTAFMLHWIIFAASPCLQQYHGRQHQQGQGGRQR